MLNSSNGRPRRYELPVYCESEISLSLSQSIMQIDYPERASNSDRRSHFVCAVLRGERMRGLSVRPSHNNDFINMTKGSSWEQLCGESSRNILYVERSREK